MLGFSIYNTLDANGYFGGDDCVKDFRIEYYLVIGDNRHDNV